MNSEFIGFMLLIITVFFMGVATGVLHVNDKVICTAQQQIGDTMPAQYECVQYTKKGLKP